MENIVNSVKPYIPVFIDLKNNTSIRIYQTYPEINSEPLYIVNLYNEHVITETIDEKVIIKGKKTKEPVKAAKVNGFNQEQLEKFFKDLTDKKLV